MFDNVSKKDFSYTQKNRTVTCVSSSPGVVGHQSIANPSDWCPVKVKTGGGDSSLRVYTDMTFESLTACRGRVRSQM